MMRLLHPNDRRDFLIIQFMLFSVQAGLQTRNAKHPIYIKGAVNFYNRDKYYDSGGRSFLKQSIFNTLDEYLSEILERGIDEERHIERINLMSEELSKRYDKVLHNKRFRIGISQKVINLFLKYMWAYGEIPEPCHCPVDGIVKSQIRKYDSSIQLEDWTIMDSISAYMAYIEAIRSIIADKAISIANWEFNLWGRH